MRFFYVDTLSAFDKLDCKGSKIIINVFEIIFYINKGRARSNERLKKRVSWTQISEGLPLFLIWLAYFSIF